MVNHIRSIDLEVGRQMLIIYLGVRRRCKALLWEARGEI